MIAILYTRYPGPQPYTTDVLTDEQIVFIAQQLPSPKATTGRPAYSNQELLPGISRVLRSGCRWRDLNLPGYPDGSTHWRRLRLWRRGLHFRWLWKRILRLLDEQNPQEKALRLKRLSIDGTLLQRFEFKEKTGYSGKHRRVGVKASYNVPQKQGDRILISCIDVDRRLEGDLITGSWVVAQCSTLLLLLKILDAITLPQKLDHRIS